MFLEFLLAFECGGASVPNRFFGEGCLSGASSLAILIRYGGGRSVGPVRAKMVLGPFAETKGPRLQGRNPASNKIPNFPFWDSRFHFYSDNLHADAGKALFVEAETFGGAVAEIDYSFSRF